MIRYCMYGLHIEPEETMSSEKKELLRKVGFFSGQS